ncbi:DNA topoisomerase 1-like [Copidosoma floridanum]|uniref:DNA topoisomerase 1-like n=1 Tax=Copidosoma floridanum TaxID=29053 RepID=UPI000C6F8819|nr:DNA topoisomerase 1-like [Copidosoma floridanum]
MESKNRRTKRKDSSDSDSDDSSSEDASPVSNKMKKISYVKREVAKKMNRTKKVLSKLCDSEDDSDPKQRLLLKRPISTLSVIRKKTPQKKDPSSDDSSFDSEDSLKKHSKKNVKTKKIINIKSKNQSTSASESDAKEETIINKKKSKVKLTKNKSIIYHTKIGIDCGTDKNEFQKPKKLKNKSSCVENNVYDDYTILETPTKSDDEAIPVDKKFEITLKHHIIQEFDKIQKITEELKETLEYNSEYVVSKQVNVVGDSKFLAHKILRIYDSTYKKLKESKNDFFKKYTEWVNTCSKNKSSKDGSYLKSSSEVSFKNRFKISSDDSSDSIDTPKKKSAHTEKIDVGKNKSLSKKSKDTSESDSSEKEKNLPKMKHRIKIVKRKNLLKIKAVKAMNPLNLKFL